MNANMQANIHATGRHNQALIFARLKPLLAEHPAPCLSLYQPTHRAFPDSQQNVVLFKNLVKELRAAVARKFPDADADTLLQHFDGLAENGELWAHPQDGIAAFAAADFFHVEKVQSAVPQLVVVNEHLHLKPLVRIFQSEDTYQVLALDRKEIRLYQGNRYVLDPVLLAPSVPRTIEDALGGEVKLQGVERTSAIGAARSGQAGLVHHGHGSKKDDVGVDMERFFRVVDRAVAEAHSKPSALPLIIAALPEYHSHFKDLSHNPYLLDEGIPVNAAALTLEKLRDEAWRVMEPRYHARLQQLVDAYHAAKARGLATDDLTHACEFACDGRIGTLVIEADRRIPGHIDGRMPRHADGGEPAAGDILDDLAERVLKMGGQVIVAPRGSMPTHTGLAAVFRY